MKSRYAKKIYLLLLCLLLISLRQAAAQPVQQITPAQWHKLKDDKAFSYKNDKELVTQTKNYKHSNFFQKAVMAFINFLVGPAGTFLMWLLVIGIVVYIIYRLAYVNGSFLFGKNKKLMIDTGQGQEEEDMATTNWETLLQQAMNNNDTRLAVRYRYMWLLQILQQAGLIQYRNDKTNYDYYTELNDTDYKQPFKQLSRLYEYAWYGNFALSATAYNDYLAHFDHLKNQLAR